MLPVGLVYSHRNADSGFTTQQWCVIEQRFKKLIYVEWKVAKKCFYRRYYTPCGHENHTVSTAKMDSTVVPTCVAPIRIVAERRNEYTDVLCVVWVNDCGRVIDARVRVTGIVLMARCSRRAVCSQIGEGIWACIYHTAKENSIMCYCMHSIVCCILV